MVFKRRKKRSYVQIVAQSLYPKGGWGRAARYIVHRLRRLPDPAHRISRGIAAGVFVCFTPFYGFHFFTAAFVAYLIRGNILASLLSTFFGNPLTFPLIATISVEFGSWILGRPAVPLPWIVSSFGRASVEIWSNITAIFTSDTTEWGRLAGFFDQVFWPYLIGGLLPGLVAGIIAYNLANPVIASYQRGRIRALKERFERKRRLAERAEAATKDGEDEAPRKVTPSSGEADA